MKLVLAGNCRMTTVRPGKKLEALIGKSLEKLGCRYIHNSNGHPACDWTASLGPDYPRLMVECKETRKDRFPFSSITTEERRQMTRWALAGDLAVLVIRRKITQIASETFCCNWLNWLQLEARSGYEHRPTIPLDGPPGRRKAGSGSVNLDKLISKPWVFFLPERSGYLDMVPAMKMLLATASQAENP